MIQESLFQHLIMNQEFIVLDMQDLNASDKENNAKLIENLNKQNIKNTCFLHSLYSNNL